MRAGFQARVCRGPSRPCPGLLERDDFRVPHTVIGVERFAEDPVIFDDDCPDHCAGAGEANAFLG